MMLNCSVIEGISSSKELKFSMAYNLTMSCIGLPIFVWASYKLWTGTHTKNFHRNIRLIVQMYLFGFILHSCGRIVLHSLDLHNYIFFSDPCQMIPNIYRCFVFRLMYNIGMWVTTCTAIPLMIERTIATFLRGRYENRYTVVGVILTAMQPGLAAFPLYLAYSNTEFSGVVMNYCSVYKPGHKEIADFNSYLAMGSQFIARLLFEVLFRVNRRFRNKLQNSSLSTRFQLEQNKNSTQCLKIYANISTVYLFAQIISFWQLLNAATNMAYVNYLALMELNMQLPLYGILTVVLVSYRASSIRNQIHTSLNSQVKLEGKQAYFDNFNKQIGTMLSKF